MGPSLSLGYRLEYQMEDAAYDSIFPLVDQWLQESSDHQEALSEIAPKRRMEKYRSMVDFISCEIFTNLQPDCFAFYRGDGPQLKEMISNEKRVAMEAFMLRVLATCYIAHVTKQKASWKSVLQAATESLKN